MVSSARSRLGLFKRPAELWPLFGGDLALAKQRLRQLIEDEDSVDGLCALVPQLSYLGDYAACERLLRKHRLLKHPLGRQSLFRVMRHQNSTNPWRVLIPAGEEGLVEACQAQLNDRAAVIEVELVGGLGDILENHTIIQSAFAGSKSSDRIRFRVTNPSSWAAVESLLSQYSLVECNGPTLVNSSNKCRSPIQERVVQWTSPLMRCVMSNAGMDETPRAIREPDQIGHEDKRIAVNWRSKLDQRYPISSFSRSIPFRQIVAFYEWVLAAVDPRTLVIEDLSEYSIEEERILRGRYPQLELVRGRLSTLADTLNLVEKCQKVISVDTSLTHLCACYGVDVMLLLPQFPDERWASLMRQGCYCDHVQILQQSSFHDWSNILRQIGKVIRSQAASSFD